VKEQKAEVAAAKKWNDESDDWPKEAEAEKVEEADAHEKAEEEAAAKTAET